MTKTKGICIKPKGRTKAKLTPEQVGEIKGRLATESNSELGFAYSVHGDTIGAIRRGESWPEIQPTPRKETP